MFNLNVSPAQLFDLFNSVLVYYGLGPINQWFFTKYYSPSDFGSIDEFKKATDVYQIDAVRLFSTFTEAFDKMSRASISDNILKELNVVDISKYESRGEWELIELINDEHLPDLGYISAKTVRQEHNERRWLRDQLDIIASDLINKIDSSVILESLSTKKKNKIDSLLRKFDSNIAHGLSSPLFLFDSDIIKRESERLAPLGEDILERMEQTQRKALKNLSSYLSSDYMDIYVATSMRTDADYISVNSFVKYLFGDSRVRPLKLRYFNPTQSWIDDRVAKGLVEALMLKRASLTIYMAQKSDTFGKDSEASVSLGQGKPVIVYVPKLRIEGDIVVDVEEYFKKSRVELSELYSGLPNSEEVDDTIDDEALIASIITESLTNCTDECICEAVNKVWADFDLYSESARVNSSEREAYRQWLDVVKSDSSHDLIPLSIRNVVIGILVATSINFEKRAKVFREVHPLALQVILSTGVLNGILVTRDVGQCAEVLVSIIKNDLNLDMTKDESNYRVVERITGSTIRVISRHRLLRNSFEAFYKSSVS